MERRDDDVSGSATGGRFGRGLRHGSRLIGLFCTLTAGYPGGGGRRHLRTGPGITSFEPLPEGKNCRVTVGPFEGLASLLS